VAELWRTLRTFKALQAEQSATPVRRAGPAPVLMLEPKGGRGAAPRVQATRRRMEADTRASMARETPSAREVTYVRDGGTIELGAMAIRLQGLAAPEWDAPNGEAATDAMRALVLGKVVVALAPVVRIFTRPGTPCSPLLCRICRTLSRLWFRRDVFRRAPGRHSGWAPSRGRWHWRQVS
jgi:hypothetical protein